MSYYFCPIVPYVLFMKNRSTILLNVTHMCLVYEKRHNHMWLTCAPHDTVTSASACVTTTCASACDTVSQVSQLVPHSHVPQLMTVTSAVAAGVCDSTGVWLLLMNCREALSQRSLTPLWGQMIPLLTGIIQGGGGHTEGKGTWTDRVRTINNQQRWGLMVRRLGIGGGSMTPSEN